MALAEIRVKAEEAQNAQIIFLNPPPRLADEANAPRANVVETADIVMHRSIRRGGKRVDGEIAPLGVLLPVAAEHHPRLAAEGLDVLAQRRDLKWTTVDDGGHGAMLDTGRHGFSSGRRDAAHHFLGQGGGRNVDLTDRNSQQCVAHGAADRARFLAVTVEQCTAASPPRRISAMRHRQDAEPRSPRRLRHEFAALDMRRHVGRAGRRAAELREHQKASRPSE